jgi:hypothetical protein
MIIVGLHYIHHIVSRQENLQRKLIAVLLVDMNEIVDDEGLDRRISLNIVGIYDRQELECSFRFNRYNFLNNLEQIGDSCEIFFLGFTKY